MSDNESLQERRTGPIVVLGASSGFGLAVANDLAGRGATVVGAARSPRPGAAEFDYQQADVTSQKDLESLIEHVVREHGTPEGLVYCPSDPGAVARSWELEAADLARVLDVTLLGFVRAVGVAVPLMREAGGGSIVLVGSRAARNPVETLAGYCSAKAAAEQYALCLAQEAGPSAIRVNIVGISADTPLAREHLRRRAAVLGRTEPYPDLPDVADSLAVARFLLGRESAFVTGQRIEARQPDWI